MSKSEIISDYVYILECFLNNNVETIRKFETEAINLDKCVEYYQKTNHYSEYYH